MPTLPLVLASLLFAAMQPPPAAPSAPVSWENPIVMDLMTVVRHPDVLGGQRVKVRVARVKEVVGPRLVIVNEPRIRGIDRTYETYFRLSELLVLLPASVSVSRGQVVAFTGVVRTVASGRALGLPVDRPAARGRKSRNDVERMTRAGNEPLLVADSITTPDGIALGGPVQ